MKSYCMLSGGLNRRGSRVRELFCYRLFLFQEVTYGDHPDIEVYGMHCRRMGAVLREQEKFRRSERPSTQQWSFMAKGVRPCANLLCLL